VACERTENLASMRYAGRYVNVSVSAKPE
jgi:hypothetical protein